MKSGSAAFLLVALSRAANALGSSIRGDGSERENLFHHDTRDLATTGEDANALQFEADMEDFLDQIGDEAHDRLTESYSQLADDINRELLEADPDLSDEKLASARATIVDLLEEDTEEISDETEDTGFGLFGDKASLKQVSQEDEADTEPNMLRGIRGRHSYYHKYRNRGCRNWRGGKGSSHKEFDLYYHVSRSYCKRKCNNLGHHCYGYEYSPHNRMCEVWTEPIVYVEHVHGVDCFVK